MATGHGDFLQGLTCVRLTGNDLRSSCAGLTRVSTSLFRPIQGVDAHGSTPWAEGPRVEPGQDEIGAAILLPLAPQQLPRTALRGRANRIPPTGPGVGGRQEGSSCAPPLGPRSRIAVSG